MEGTPFDQNTRFTRHFLSRFVQRFPEANLVDVLSNVRKPNRRELAYIKASSEKFGKYITRKGLGTAKLYISDESDQKMVLVYDRKSNTLITVYACDHDTSSVALPTH